MYTTSTAFLEALVEAGVSCIFANFGSDHPALIEALAEAKATGRPVPEVITCPNEMVALSAAHGHARVSGRAQAVVVHVECGTQALAGAVHNADKGRAPVLIFAGASPFTQDGELKGSRNEFIQWIQDVGDQRGLVRGYMRYDNEIRSGRNVKQLVHRAMQFAHSDPAGPVYLMGAREVMEEEVPPVAIDMDEWGPIAPCALAPAGAQAIADALLAARRPLVVTSYIGRKPEAVALLDRLCTQFGVGVTESVPNYVNFPNDNPMYLGNQWNQPVQNRALGDADMVLVMDSDVPWIPTVSRPKPGAAVFHIDADPLKSQMPLWYIPARQRFRADCATALQQILDALDGRAKAASKTIAERRGHYTRLHRERAEALTGRERPTDAITPEYLTACVRNVIDDDTIVMSEGITAYHTICDHLRRNKAGGLFTSGGGSLGWNGGAAIGAKLAAPDKTVVALTGDGSYMFSVPSSVHWMARRYGTPFLQVIYNNRGWKAPKMSMLAMHPGGYAARADEIGVSFDPPPDYSAIAAASGGAHARKVEKPEELEEALAEALDVVKTGKRCAVLDVVLPHL
jgi:acetolactate synthase I/II/III large subunit